MDGINIVCQRQLARRIIRPMSTPDLRQADLDSRHAAMSLSAALPCDIVLYLLLPMYADQFHVSLAEAGVLLAANRLVRIAGYRWVASFYARRGDRPTCLMAVCAAVVCALGYTVASGFWALLPLRLLWGMAFAGLNLSTQAMPRDLARPGDRPDPADGRYRHQRGVERPRERRLVSRASSSSE